jgi:RHH-type proline utilization regulon transcriptional repressor/proline dehydrogenase/delta 1-pyrroline-5-carboxylate dehydrogenase
MASNMAADAPLIAETGGLNAMIVDSTALLEQTVTDVVRSAFQSAGQRCSALRVIYLQDDIYQEFITMLTGAMDELHIGNPWDLATDVGPLISAQAQRSIQEYIDSANKEGRVIKSMKSVTPDTGHFIAPTAIKVDGIESMGHEIFGPVLHVARFAPTEIDSVIKNINASGYGLTFCLHTRINRQVDDLTKRLNVGNMYINRDQIGAVVGSQPFGGESLSGTGPKAGGPRYLKRFMQTSDESGIRSNGEPHASCEAMIESSAIQSKLDALFSSSTKSRSKLSETSLPGPTGESNILSEYGRGVILCLGPSAEQAQKQAQIAVENGCQALIINPEADNGSTTLKGRLDLELLGTLSNFDAVALYGNASKGDKALKQARKALADRQGKIIPLLCDDDQLSCMSRLERHICIDTTAAGGNTSLLAQSH